MIGRRARLQCGGLFVLLLFVSVLAAGQTPEMRERISVSLVEVPLTVVNRSGEPETGLDVSDFELYDDGKRVPISHFEIVDLQNVVPGARVNPAARLNVVILLDLSYSTPASMRRARDAASTFIQEHLSPEDRMAVVTYTVESGLKVLTSFTSDEDLLQLAIDSLGNPRFFQPSDPLRLSGRSPSGASSTGLAQSGNEGEAMEIAEIFDRINQGIEDEFQRARVQRQFENFGHFARMLESVRGRKQIVLLSEGFDPKLVHGREMGTAREIQDLEAVIHGQPWRVSMEDRYGFAGAQNDLHDMAELFRRSDVVLHAVDIKGVRTRVDAQEGFRRDSNEALFLMAHPTGGMVFKNDNDLAENLGRMIRQQKYVYVLGFSAQATGTEGKFHRLEVKLVDVPGARVSHRAGYYEESAKLETLEQTLGTADILLNDIPQREIPLSTLAVSLGVEKHFAIIPVIVEIPGEALLADADSESLDLDVFIYAFEPDNTVRDFRHQLIELDLSTIGTRLSSSGVKLYATLRVPPGEYAVKTLVRVAQTERTGFERRDVKVVSEGEASLLPPLVVEPEGRWIMVKAPPRTREEVPYPFHVADESFVPAAGVSMRRGERYRVALFGYGIDYRDSEIRAGLRTTTGARRQADIEVIASSPAAAGEPGKLVMSFDTTDVPAGRYHLDFAIDPRGGGRHVATLALDVEEPNEELRRKQTPATKE